MTEGQAYVLRDVGSSNGTGIDGEKIQEHVLVVAEEVRVEFGSGGPILRLWLGDDNARAPSIMPIRFGWRRFLPW